jgi:hypothetical protein
MSRDGGMAVPQTPRFGQGLSTSHVFACLVHERPDVVVDLVRNLRALEPDASILLYDGSRTGGLLAQADLPADERVLVHPSPRPMRWGRLHDFAVDSMRHALREADVEAITIVDSDQLLIRPGFAAAVAAVLAARPAVGLLGNAPDAQPRNSRVDPVRHAWREADRWRAYLSRLPGGSAAFPHWTFWPSTVFSRTAAESLVELFEDPALERLVRATRIWATEEIILPTLVAGLGFEVAASPGSFDYVRYRRPYSAADIAAALTRPDVFWVHPIPRVLDDPLRAQIRRAHQGYGRAPVAAPRARRHSVAQPAPPPGDGPATPASLSVDGAALAAPRDVARILDTIAPIAGWLEPDEGRLLAGAASWAVRATAGLPIVEIGSFAGRGTVLLASIAKRAQPAATVFAIDRFDGVVGEAGIRLYRTGTTLSDFEANVAATGVGDSVEAIAGQPARIPWDRRIGLLVVDGLHDYASVSGDFRHYSSWLAPNGLVAFHDHASYYPGVVRFVGELLVSGRYDEVARAGSLIVLRPRAGDEVAATAVVVRPNSPPAATAHPIGRPPLPESRRPLVSCIMPTFDRRAYVPAAIRQFLAQDYPERELIVLDDGSDPVEDLIPADDRIRYVRLGKRLTIGAKRNVGCEHARGEILAHWDDDDWVASWRLRYEVDALLEHRADVVGIQTLLYLDRQSGRGWRFRYRGGGTPWVHDPTFCYRREAWKRQAFPDSNYGLDLTFLRTGPRKEVVALSDYRFYVGILHPGNTSPKRTRGPSWEPYDAAAIDALMAGATPPERSQPRILAARA